LKERREPFGPEEILKQADRMSDEQFEKLAAKVFKGARTAAQLVAEGRERHS